MKYLKMFLLLIFLITFSSVSMAGRSTQDFYYQVDDLDVTSIRVYMYPVSGSLNTVIHPYVTDSDLDGHVIMENIPNGAHYFLIVLYEGTLAGQLCYEQEITKLFEVIPGCSTAFSFEPLE